MIADILISIIVGVILLALLCVIFGIFILCLALIGAGIAEQKGYRPSEREGGHR